MYDNILFDLDDTLLDFSFGERQGIQEVFSSENIEFNEENFEKYRKINKNLWMSLEKGEISKNEVLTKRFEEFFKLFDIKVNPQEKEDIFRKNINNSYKLIDGAVEILEYLKNKGKKIYTASNGLEYTQMIRMKKSGIYDYFSNHFISEKVGYEKPNTLFFEYCMSNIKGANKQNTIMIGDSLSSDIKGANDYGIDSCYLNIHKTQDKSMTYKIDKLIELKEII